MAKVFVYLAKRDKTAIRLLATLPGNSYPASRVNLEDLNLTDSLRKDLKQEVSKNKMMWELWIQGAESWAEVQNSLRKRGYKNVPYFSKPEYYERMTVNGEKKSILQNIKPIKTMMRKGSFKPSEQNDVVSRKHRRKLR